MKREELLSYFNHRYSADNTIIAITGKLDFERMVIKKLQVL